MAADAASFKTSIDSTSAGFKKDNPSGTGIPSITMSGLDPALSELIPLILILGAAPASEETFWICTPAILPCKA